MSQMVRAADWLAAWESWRAAGGDAPTPTVAYCSDWRVVDQPMINAFAAATRDEQWLHVDAERAARESPWRDAAGHGRTVAHGFLTLSLLTHLFDDTVTVVDRVSAINAGFDRVRFTAPVPPGARVRGQFTLADVKQTSTASALMVALTWDVTVELDDNGTCATALVARWLTSCILAAPT